MIIQCEQCQTKFRLDDSRVTDKGVKVRCAKCKHVFTVRAQPETESQADFGALLDQDASFGPEERHSGAFEPQQEGASQESQSDFGALLDRSVSFEQREGSSAPFGTQTEGPAAEPQAGSGFDYSDFIAEDFSRQDEPIAAASPVFPVDEPPAPAGEDFSLSSLDGELGFTVEQEETPSATGAAGFAGLDFGGDAADADKTVVAAALAPDFGNMAVVQPPVADRAAETDDSTAFGFGEEAPFGSAAIPTAGTPDETAGFVAPPDGFDDSTSKDSAVLAMDPAVPADGRDEETFSMGEIDFGGEPASATEQQAQPDEFRPAEDQPVAPSALVTETPVIPAGQDTIRKSPEAEPPPLSITSRRKYNPVFNILIVVATVVAVAVLGFFGYTMFQEDKEKVVAETGRITVRAVNASFVKNPEAGDLLVITGEAVNAFSKPRAAIKIKGMIFGANGQVLAAKAAYCGNPLTKEQLTGMPLEKIEAAMANQFGDSLTNLEVAPGKAIPFVIVIAKPPADARDYGVEPAGSTVATGKQQ